VSVTLQENSHFATLHLRQLWDNCRKVYFLRNLQRFVRRFWQPSQMLLLKSGMKFTLARNLKFFLIESLVTKKNWNPYLQKHKKLNPLNSQNADPCPSKLIKRSITVPSLYPNRRNVSPSLPIPNSFQIPNAETFIVPIPNI
jgi:hypothetical protein